MDKPVIAGSPAALRWRQRAVKADANALKWWRKIDIAPRGTGAHTLRCWQSSAKEAARNAARYRVNAGMVETI